MALTRAAKREWQFLDLLCANICADLRSFRLDGGRISHHGQRFRHSAGLQREFERGCRVDLDNDSRLFLDPKAGGGGAHVIRANTNVLNAEAARRAGDGVVIRTSFRAGDGYFGVGNGAAGAVEDGAGDGAAVGLSESRYCGEGKEKTNEKKPQQGQIESHSPPQLYRTVNKPSTSAASESQKNSSPPKRSIEIAADGPVTGKNAEEGVAASGFRNRLLGTRLSVPAEGCQVLFLVAIWIFDGRSLGGEIVIGFVWALRIDGGKRFPSTVYWLGGTAAVAPRRQQTCFSRGKKHGPHNEGSGQTRRSLARYGLPRPQQDPLHLCGDREARFRSRRADEILQKCTRPAVGHRPERFVRAGDFGDRQPVFPRNHSRIPGRRLGSRVRRPSLQHPI